MFVAFSICSFWNIWQVNKSSALFSICYMIFQLLSERIPNVLVIGAFLVVFLLLWSRSESYTTAAACLSDPYTLSGLTTHCLWLHASLEQDAVQTRFIALLGILSMLCCIWGLIWCLAFCFPYSAVRILTNFKMLLESLRAPNLYGIYSGMVQENSNGVKYDSMGAVLVLFALSLMRPDMDQLCFFPASIFRMLPGDLVTATCPQPAVKRKAIVDALILMLQIISGRKKFLKISWIQFNFYIHLYVIMSPYFFYVNI